MKAKKDSKFFMNDECMEHEDINMNNTVTASNSGNSAYSETDSSENCTVRQEQNLFDDGAAAPITQLQNLPGPPCLS